MITLLTYPAALGVFSPSPFCVKARHLLHFAGVEWQREDTLDPRKMPYGKLPAIRTPSGRIIADSNNIQRWLEQEGTDFQARLSDRDKAHSLALIRMAEEHLYFICLLDRWGRDASWPTVRDIYFKEMPQPIRSFIAGGLRKTVLKGMKTQGLGRLSDEERLKRAEIDFTAISNLLWSGGFLFGDAPSLADLSIGPMLEACVSSPVETPLVRRVREDPLLMDYLTRFNAEMGL